MCQPACRGGNKRSRNTSNPTLICPYRSTMVSQADRLFHTSTSNIQLFGVFYLRPHLTVKVNSLELDFCTSVCLFLCEFQRLCDKSLCHFSENLMLRIYLNFTQRNFKALSYFPHTKLSIIGTEQTYPLKISEWKITKIQDAFLHVCCMCVCVCVCV